MLAYCYCVDEDMAETIVVEKSRWEELHHHEAEVLVPHGTEELAGKGRKRKGGGGACARECAHDD